MKLETSSNLQPASESLASRLRATLTYIPEFPTKGFSFPDITPLLEQNPELFRDTIGEFLHLTSIYPYNTVLCIESFGYIFGVPIAYERGCRIALMRRATKLPRPTFRAHYDMCYDHARCMEIHRDALLPSSRVLVVDDFLVSGGTVKAALELVRMAGAEATAVACVVEKLGWGARAALKTFDVPIITLTTIS